MLYAKQDLKYRYKN